MKIPQKGKIYSVNEGNTSKWSKGIQEYVHTRKFPSEGQQAMNARYVGSMVSDIHRTLLYGGIFMYPGMKDKPMGKVFLFPQLSSSIVSHCILIPNTNFFRKRICQSESGMLCKNLMNISLDIIAS